MIYKGFGWLVKALFGLGGIVTVVITWVREVAPSYGILLTLIGLSSISLALSTVILFELVLSRVGIIRNSPQVQSGKERDRCY
jgi:hypothetical protein